MKMSTEVSILNLNKKTKRYEFNEEKFAEIVTRPEIEGLPIAIVSIVGDYCKGKRFLLNFFLRYLQRYDQRNWLGRNDEPLEGFLWRSKLDTDSVGIVFWPEPLVITRKDGTKIAVILTDTHGPFDDKTKHDDCANFYAISTMISSIQIYVQEFGCINDDITMLSKFSEFARDYKNLSERKAFQKLLILIRMMSKDSFDLPGATGGREILEFHKKHKDWKTLYDCYSEIDCFLMSYAGESAYTYSFNGELTYLDIKFIRNLLELIPSLLSPETIVTKTWFGKEQKAADITNLFKSLVENLGPNQKCTKIGDLMEIVHEAQFVTATRKAFAKFLMIYSESNPLNNPKKVIESSFTARVQAIDYYMEETMQIDDHQMIENFRQQIMEMIDDYIEHLVTNKRHENILVKQNQVANSSWYQFVKGGKLNFNLNFSIFGAAIDSSHAKFILDKLSALPRFYAKIKGTFKKS